jgi:hypothetical protein
MSDNIKLELLAHELGRSIEENEKLIIKEEACKSWSDIIMGMCIVSMMISFICFIVLMGN